MPMSRARNSGSASRTAPPSTSSALGGSSGSSSAMRSRNCCGLDREQADLFLLHEHRQHGAALAGLDHERARARATERAGRDVVDGIELDEVGHADASSAGDSAARSSGSGRRSSSPPVSLHFTIITP